MLPTLGELLDLLPSHKGTTLRGTAWHSYQLAGWLAG